MDIVNFLFQLPGGGVTQGSIAGVGNLASGMFTSPLGWESLLARKVDGFDKVFSSGGKKYSLSPDFISRQPFGNSFTAFSGHTPVGFVGFNPLNSQFSIGGSLQPHLGTAMGSTLRSLNQLWREHREYFDLENYSMITCSPYVTKNHEKNDKNKLRSAAIARVPVANLCGESLISY